jgi:hypothetical protein
LRKFCSAQLRKLVYIVYVLNKVVLSASKICMETEFSSDFAYGELQVWTSTSCLIYHKGTDGVTMMMFPSLLFL